MDQTIGIGYRVEGVGNVVAENNKVIASFDNVIHKIEGFASKMGGFKSAFDGLGKSMAALGGSKIGDSFKGSTSLRTAAVNTEKLNLALEVTPARATSAASALNKLSSAVRGYNAQMSLAVKQSKTPITPNMGAPGGMGGAGGKGGSIFPGLGWRVPEFMFMWRAGSEALRAAHYGIADILLGKAREGLSKPLGELSAVGMNASQKAEVEFNAKQFSQKFWTVSTEKYIDAMSYTASGFDINAIGSSNLTKLHEASMKMSMVAKMSAEKSAAMMTKSVLAILSQLPADVAEKLRAGGSADVKDFGVVTIGELGEKLTGQYLKAMKSTMMWGPDIQNAFKYALPNFLEMGWSPSGALAFTGSLVNAGFHAGQSGRGIKDIFVKEEDTFAKIFVKGLGRWQEEGKFDKNTGQELTATERKIHAENNRRSLEAARGLVHKYLQKPETAAEMLSKAGQLYRKLTDPAQGGKETSKSLGVSTQFQPLFLTYTKKSFDEEMVKLKDKIENASYDDVDRIVKKSVQDVGSAYGRIMNAFENLATSLADWPGAKEIAKTISEPLDFLRTKIDLQKKVLTRGSGEGGRMTAGEITATQLEHGKQLEMVFGTEKADELKKMMWDTWRTGRGGVMAAIRDSLLGGTSENAFSLDPADTLNKLRSLKMSDFFSKQQEESMQPLIDFFQGAAETWNKTDVLSAAVDYFWDSVTYPFYAAAKAMDEAEQLIRGAVMAPINKIIEMFSGSGKQVEPPPIPQTQEGLPGPLQPVEPEFNPFRFGSYTPQQPIHIELASQPLHIDNQMVIDGRVLAQAVAEIIQNNRDVNYCGFGADPMGFVT